MVSLKTMVVAAGQLVTADLGGEVAILHMGNGIYYGLDGVGARIWALIQEPSRVDDVWDSLVAEYDVQPDQCQSDLLKLLEKLASEGLIEITEP